MWRMRIAKAAIPRRPSSVAMCCVRREDGFILESTFLSNRCDDCDDESGSGPVDAKQFLHGAVIGPVVALNFSSRKRANLGAETLHQDLLAKWHRSADPGTNYVRYRP